MINKQFKFEFNPPSISKYDKIKSYFSITGHQSIGSLDILPYLDQSVNDFGNLCDKLIYFTLFYDSIKRTM